MSYLFLLCPWGELSPCLILSLYCTLVLSLISLLSSSRLLLPMCISSTGLTSIFMIYAMLLSPYDESLHDSAPTRSLRIVKVFPFHYTPWSRRLRMVWRTYSTCSAFSLHTWILSHFPHLLSYFVAFGVHREDDFHRCSSEYQ